MLDTMRRNTAWILLAILVSLATTSSAGNSGGSLVAAQAVGQSRNICARFMFGSWSDIDSDCQMSIASKAARGVPL